MAYVYNIHNYGPGRFGVNQVTSEKKLYRGAVVQLTDGRGNLVLARIGERETLTRTYMDHGTWTELFFCRQNPDEHPEIFSVTSTKTDAEWQGPFSHPGEKTYDTWKARPDEIAPQPDGKVIEGEVVYGSEDDYGELVHEVLDTLAQCDGCRVRVTIKTLEEAG